jgi:hypothetical protein
MSSPQRGIAPATIAYKAIVLTTTTMGADSPTWTRTRNTLINSQILCQLSYRGMVWRINLQASWEGFEPPTNSLEVNCSNKTIIPVMDLIVK